MFAVPLETPRTVIERSSGAAAGGLAPPLELGPQALVFESVPSWKVTVDPLGSSLATLLLVELKPNWSSSPESTLQSLSPSSPVAITRRGTPRVSPSLTVTTSNCVGAGELSSRFVTVSANAADANANVNATDKARTLNVFPNIPLNLLLPNRRTPRSLSNSPLQPNRQRNYSCRPTALW